MDHMKSPGVIKPWMSLIWHNVVKIDVVEKLANFEANFEGEGVEIREMDWIYPERGGSELSEYQIRFLLSCMVRPQISIEIDLFLWILVHFLTFSASPRIPINPDFHENTVNIKWRRPLTRYTVTTWYHEHSALNYSPNSQNYAVL